MGHSRRGRRRDRASTHGAIRSPLEDPSTEAGTTRRADPSRSAGSVRRDQRAGEGQKCRHRAGAPPLHGVEASCISEGVQPEHGGQAPKNDREHRRGNGPATDGPNGSENDPDSAQKHQRSGTAAEAIAARQDAVPRDRPSAVSCRTPRSSGGEADLKGSRERQQHDREHSDGLDIHVEMIPRHRPAPGRVSHATGDRRPPPQPSCSNKNCVVPPRMTVKPNWTGGRSGHSHMRNPPRRHRNASTGSRRVRATSRSSRGACHNGIVDWHASAGGFCDMRSRAIHDLFRRTSEFRREPRATTSFGATVGNNDAAVFNDRKVRTS